MCVCVSVWVYGCEYSVFRDQKRAPAHLHLELKVVVNSPTWALRRELRPSAASFHTCNHWASPPAPRAACLYDWTYLKVIYKNQWLREVDGPLCHQFQFMSVDMCCAPPMLTFYSRSRNTDLWTNCSIGLSREVRNFLQGDQLRLKFEEGTLSHWIVKFHFYKQLI